MPDTSMIKAHMEVLGSDGEHVGVVDRVESDRWIKLTRDDPAAQGQHHIIPASWIENVDEHVHLREDSKSVFENWEAV